MSDIVAPSTSTLLAASLRLLAGFITTNTAFSEWGLYPLQRPTPSGGDAESDD
jgi:hypothetical protein